MTATSPDVLGLAGSLFGDRYELHEHLVSGGIAAVYRGVDTQTQAHVAVKVLDTRHADKDRVEELKNRFDREAEACRGLSSPHFARMTDYGTVDQSLHYIATEWAEGETLHDRMRSQGAGKPASLIRIFIQLCHALSEAHGAGIVHRDLKPGNVLLVPAVGGGDFVKLLDFGLAKHLDADITLTRAGSVMGTPTYMAPEQIEGAASVDHRADIYSLGVMLFRGLTNKRPFGGKHPAEVMQGHLRKPVPAIATVNPDVKIPRNLEWVVRTCMHKTREDRFADVNELRLALRFCELQGDGEIDDEHSLNAVDGRLDISDELRERLHRLKAPTPTPAVIRRRVSTAAVAGAAGGIGLAAILALGFGGAVVLALVLIALS